jgi:hydroxymethylpyrimidine pyrophosphatase-like HAD family hydrolase
MKQLVVTDLDGTLLRPDHGYHPRDLETLRELGAQGIVRCIATGRSLYSVRQVLPETMPVDYVIVSSGAAILSWPDATMLDRHAMTALQVERAFGALHAKGLDFMVHDPVPENHRFTYFAATDGPDFRRRIGRYHAYARPGDARAFVPAESSQLLAVIDGDAAGECSWQAIRQDLAGLSVFRATSPLDGQSIWIEVFPPTVSKSQAAARVASRHGVRTEDALAVGNDYNDEDLLAWAGMGVVVPGAPRPLRARFRELERRDGAVLASAVEAWTRARGRQPWK